jgi:hypothetical protein
MMAKVTVSNTGRGPRGVNTTTGTVVLAKGESRELDVSDAEIASMRAGGALSVRGDALNAGG